MNLSSRAKQRLAALVDAHPRLVPQLDTTRLDWVVPGLSPELDGFTIAQVSDVHVGEGEWRTFRLCEAIEAIRRAKPDVVVNTGDFLQGEPPVEKLIAEYRPLLEAAGRAEHIAILGNHDYYAGEEHVRDLKGWLRDLGVFVLVNEVRAVGVRGATVTFAGFTCEEPGMDAAAKQLLNSPQPRIALVHEPDVAERLPGDVAELIVAGHTHGGQITLPWLEKPIVKRFCGSNYVEGMYTIGANPVYVNRGLGATGLPLRFRARPELALIRLRR